MSIWSDRIKEIENGGTQLSVLAKEIGVPVSTLSEIKSERTKEPRYDLGVKILMTHGRLLCKPGQVIPNDSGDMAT